MKTSAKSTTKSLAVMTPGTLLQPSEQAVARLETPPDELSCDPNTVKALTAVVLGLMAETLSGDAIVLAMYRAEDTACKQGVSRQEWERVKQIVLSHWKRERSRNPLSALF